MSITVDYVVVHHGLMVQVGKFEFENVKCLHFNRFLLSDMHIQLETGRNVEHIYK